MNKCLECGTDIINGKFCSKSHAAIYNNKKYPKRTKGRTKPNCLNCNNELNVYYKKFCDNKCQQEFYYKTKYLPLILEGKGGNVKKYLKNTRGDVCEICGQNNYWNGKPLELQLDHIDGNSDNNILTNLRLLCPNCHTQTDTYTARNIKNTQRNSYLRSYKKQVKNKIV